jgi:hypothetical protein
LTGFDVRTSGSLLDSSIEVARHLPPAPIAAGLPLGVVATADSGVTEPDESLSNPVRSTLSMTITGKRPSRRGVKDPAGERDRRNRAPLAVKLSA